MKQIIFITILFSIVSCGVSNRLPKPKIINVNGDYIHYKTKLTFPEHIFNFNREDITSFDEKTENVGVTYSSTDNNSTSNLTIYIYPAGSPTESRLTQQYFASLQSIANIHNNGIDITQSIIPYKKNNYAVQGLYAEINDKEVKTSLTLFECGKWFLKYRISTNSKDENYMDTLRTKLLENFCPTEIVKIAPVEPRTIIHLAPAALKDSLFVSSILENIKSRLKWINNNVDTLERCSGFPNLYLESHSGPMKDMVMWYEENKEKYQRESWDNEYILSTKKIIDNGFLNEFLMDEYSMLLITPDNIHFQFEEYYKWKKKNLPGFNLKDIYFVLEYTE